MIYVFLRGKRINLTVSEPTCFINLLNQDFDGSQLHRMPLLNPMDTDSKNLILAITDDSTGKLLGRVSLENIDHLNMTAEFKIFMFPECQCKGYAFEASQLIINHGFNELNLQRIHCGTLDNNIGFQKLAKKLKFSEEGRRIMAVYKGGVFHNVIEYGLLK